MKVVTAHPIIDGVLDQHFAAIGDDLGAYRNHVYRCLNYHQLLLGAPPPDTAALAWAVHDLGIWTADTFDYLSPSTELVATHATEFGITDVDEVRLMVTQHHKLRRTGNRMNDAFRTADLVDVSRGHEPSLPGLPRVSRTWPDPTRRPSSHPAAADAAVVMARRSRRQTRPTQWKSCS